MLVIIRGIVTQLTERQQITKVCTRDGGFAYHFHRRVDMGEILDNWSALELPTSQIEFTYLAIGRLD